MTKKHPPGSIVIPVRDDLARYNQFSMTLMGMQRPAGTKLSFLTGISIAQSLNLFLASEWHGDWLLIMGDDHMMPPDMLMNLLDREVDAVAPIAFTRRAPFFTNIFREQITRPPKPGFPDGVPGWVTYDTDEVPDSGLMEVHAVGSAGLLVRRHVIDAIDPPWFENLDTVHAGEDLIFCDKIRQAGFPIHVDLDVRLGHLGTIVTSAQHHPEHGWGVFVEFAGGSGGVFMPGLDHRKDGETIDGKATFQGVDQGFRAAVHA